MKRVPISNCTGNKQGEYSEMKVTLTQRREESRGIVLESKILPGLRFAAERRGLLTSKTERLQHELKTLGADCVPWGSFIVEHDFIAEMQYDESVHMENPTAGMHI